MRTTEPRTIEPRSGEPRSVELQTAILDQATRVLARNPDDAAAYFARGTALRSLRRPHAAREALTRAVVLNPGMAAGWLNLGNVLSDLGHPQEAERHYRSAVRHDPLMAEAWTSLGHLLLEQGLAEEAVTACETAVRLNPGLAEAGWNLAVALLLSGDWPRGFQAYEGRKAHPGFRAAFPPLPGPCWDGRDPRGHVILVRAEQGLGDTIQCARYLRLIVERGGTPVLTCDPGLVPLIATMPGVVALPHATRVEGYDAWIDLMSLPLVFGTDRSTVPLADGYLPFPRLSARAGGLRIGIAWAGNPAHANDRRRSLPSLAVCSLLAPLLAISGVTFVNLQVGRRAKEAGLPDGSAALPDFRATAALVASLDLVISVDSAVAHLAGALGVPVWILLPHAPDWRWLLGREDSPWYASARLFRQAEAGDWGGVIARVIAALKAARPPGAGSDRGTPGTARIPRFAPGR